MARRRQPEPTRIPDPPFHSTVLRLSRRSKTGWVVLTIDHGMLRAAPK